MVMQWCGTKTKLKIIYFLKRFICLFLHNGYIELVVHDIGLFCVWRWGTRGWTHDLAHTYQANLTLGYAANPAVKNFSKIDRNLLIQEHSSIFLMDKFPNYSTGINLSVWLMNTVKIEPLLKRN